MPCPIDKKLVIAIASSALFDLSESNRMFQVNHPINTSLHLTRLFSRPQMQMM